MACKIVSNCPSPRTYPKLTCDDLKNIRDFVLSVELPRFLSMKEEKYSVYRDKLIAIALCQGAALHFIDKKNGVKDIDVWFFFEEDEKVKIPHRNNMLKSYCIECPNFGVKRIDCLKKMISLTIIGMAGSKDPLQVLRTYLKHAGTQTAYFLSQKPCIILYPNSYFCTRV